MSKALSRKEILEKSLDNYGYILIAKDMDEAIETANEIASEHLEIQTQRALPGDDEDQKCGGDFYRGIQLRASGRLFCRPQPCAAHQRHRKVFLAFKRG